MQYFSVMLVRVRMVMTAAIAVIVVIVVMATAAAVVVMIVVMATAIAVVMIVRMVGLVEYALYLYGGVIVHMQALAAVIANF